MDGKSLVEILTFGKGIYDGISSGFGCKSFMSVCKFAVLVSTKNEFNRSVFSEEIDGR
jgi:hypothetical protein